MKVCCRVHGSDTVSKVVGAAGASGDRWAWGRLGSFVSMVGDSGGMCQRHLRSSGAGSTQRVLPTLQRHFEVPRVPGDRPTRNLEPESGAVTNSQDSVDLVRIDVVRE